MNESLFVWSAIVFVEKHVRGAIDMREMAASSGISLAHMRDVFKRRTGRSLGRYITERRIANAAHDMLTKRQTAIFTAHEYGFTNPDTFTRAFARITGMTPSEFVKKRPPMGTVRLCGGLLAVGFLDDGRFGQKGRIIGGKSV